MAEQQVRKDFVIAGTQLQLGATALVKRLPQLTEFKLVREPTNKFDTNAIMVTWGEQQQVCGYIPRLLAAELAPLIDAGVKIIVRRKRDVRFGVCELAYIPPEPKEVPNDDESESESGAGAPGNA